MCRKSKPPFEPVRDPGRLADMIASHIELSIPDKQALLATLDQPTRDHLDITGLLRRLLAAKIISISTFGTDGQWGEIDNPADVDLYESMVRDHELMLEDPFMAPDI